MTVNSVELVKKINHVRTSRYLKVKNIIEEHLDFPRNEEHEEEMLKNAIFQFLKRKFVGCKLRAGGESISLRLDGAIHRKANKLREIFNHEHEWRTWFENNHRNIYSTWRSNRSNWSSGNVQIRNLNDKTFVYVPFKPSRIRNYYERGLVQLLDFLSNEHMYDSNIANIYDEAIRLMEAEVERRERERRERIERELNDYLRGLRNRLYKSTVDLQESDDAVDRRLAQKLTQWARANGKAPEYAVPATYTEMVPQNTKVQVMNQVNSQEENWYVVPMFEGFELPEGYELQEGWGRVTRHDAANERSRGGIAPIVVEEYIFLQFNMEHWQHLLPEGYQELLEVTERFRKEAEEEMAPVLAEEKLKQEKAEAEEKKRAAEAKKLEEEARRVAQERALEESREMERRLRDERERQEQQEREQMERAQQESREQQERRRRLAEQLRAQVTQEEVPYTPPQVIPSDERAEATESGLYRNMRAIPLERYVAINGEGERRRFRTPNDAATWLGISHGDNVRIRDFHAPHEAVENYEHRRPTPSENQDGLPF